MMRAYLQIMSSQLSFSFISIALLFAVASARFGHQAPGSDLVFSYAGLNGPANWGSLNPKFSTCSSGKLQSPVNIIKNEAVENKKLTPLTRDYKLGKAILVNNGFNIGLLYEGNCGVLIIDGKNFTFKQMHWHSPSEHRIDGIQYAAQSFIWSTCQILALLLLCQCSTNLVMLIRLSVRLQTSWVILQRTRVQATKKPTFLLGHWTISS
ncbi:hypothetical protein OIU84_026190 [Salix udensis]|uniref:Alpha-carbonic anhydrase domain-containing protein n=1 Tax=Salix udensis TaxID=889485 RepID=A0AAD6KMK5_9ROSI|nr:hypothetical protein OIU84_026190 [Salix udensis]